MRVKVSNIFHGTSKEISIKHSYIIQDFRNGYEISKDTLTTLYYNATQQNDSYAIRKLKEIKKVLCGQSDCHCDVVSLISKI